MTPGGELGQPVELAPGVFILFTGRGGGVSTAPYDTLNLGRGVGDDPAAVAANRRRAARACGLGAERLTWMRQVHGASVRYATAAAGSGEPSRDGPGAADPAVPEADATYTDVSGLALGVLAADCAPVLLADPRARTRPGCAR